MGRCIGTRIITRCSIVICAISNPRRGSEKEDSIPASAPTGDAATASDNSDIGNEVTPALFA